FGYRIHPIFRRRIHHNGIDFAAPAGYRIRAAETGYVIVAGEKREYHGYGKVTVIDHGARHSDGKRISTVYAHQSRVLAKEGELVKQGEEIGWVGSTGYTTGPHLHFEVREDGVPVDPMRYLR
ncbi:M23 family metallopeptidase, partial [bacterium]|nr:M23 family metallopeptidase [bacterium]